MGANTIADTLTVEMVMELPRRLEEMSRQMEKAMNMGLLYGNVVHGMDLARPTQQLKPHYRKMWNRIKHLKFRTVTSWKKEYDEFYREHPGFEVPVIYCDNLDKIKKFYSVLYSGDRPITLAVNTNESIEKFLVSKKLEVFSGLGT